MKSKWFEYFYCGNSRFSQKEYNRSIYNQINDTKMVSNIEENELELILSKAENTLKHKIKPPKKACKKAEFLSLFKVNTIRNFEIIWKHLPEKVIFIILDFVEPLDLFALMCTARFFNTDLRKKALKRNTTKAIKTQFSDPGILTHPDFIYDFHNSLRYSLNPLTIFHSGKVFSCGNDGTQKLTQYLVDFQPLKDEFSRTNLKKISYIFTYMHSFLDNTLFLSHMKDENALVLWAMSNSKKKFPYFVIHKQIFTRYEEMLSAKFCGEQFLIFQTREKEIKTENNSNLNYKYEVYIFDIKAELQNFWENNCSIKSCLHHGFSIEFSLLENNILPQDPVLLGREDNFLEIQGYFLIERFLFQKQGKRLILYSQSQPGIVLIYNLQARKIEAVHLCKHDFEILGLVVSKKKTSNDSLSIILIGTNLQLHLLTYTFTGNNFNMQEIKYTESLTCPKEIPLSQEYRKYQYGSFYNGGGLVSDYIILNQQNDFYYLPLDSFVPKKVTHTQSLEQTTINSWHIFEDLLAVMYDCKYIVIFKITPEGDFKELTPKRQLIFYESSWKSETRRVMERLSLAKSLEKSTIPPFIMMNHSYLIIINFPSPKQEFQIFFNSLPEILMDKVTVQPSFSYINANREAWKVESEDIFNRNPQEFLKRYDNIINNGNIVKFKDNKLFLMFESLNLFYNLQTHSNRLAEGMSFKQIPDNFTFLKINTPTVSQPEMNQATRPNNNAKYHYTYQIKLLTNKNHMNPLNLNNNKIPSESQEYLSEDEMDDQTLEKSKNAKLKRKEIFRKVVKCAKKENYIIGEYHLHSLGGWSQKEWYLRRVGKKKTQKNRKFNRNIRMDNGESCMN